MRVAIHKFKPAGWGGVEVTTLQTLYPETFTQPFAEKYDKSVLAVYRQLSMFRVAEYDDLESLLYFYEICYGDLCALEQQITRYETFERNRRICNAGIVEV